MHGPLHTGNVHLTNPASRPDRNPRGSQKYIRVGRLGSAVRPSAYMYAERGLLRASFRAWVARLCSFRPSGVAFGPAAEVKAQKNCRQGLAAAQ